MTIAGYALGRAELPAIDRLRVFKEELADLLVGMLFLLLSAGLDISAFQAEGPALVAAVAAMMLVVRPLSIGLSTRGYGLEGRERLFLAWMAPRGIVAASMASLFAIALADHPLLGARAPFLETLTYAVIAGTVVVQGSTAGLVARALGVTLAQPSDWLVVGAHTFARSTTRMLADRGEATVLVDTNGEDVAAARAEGLHALWANALTLDTERHVELQSVGHILVLTPNADLNVRIARHLRDEIPGARVQLWVPEGPGSERLPGECVFEEVDLPAIVAGRGQAAIDVHTRPEWLIVSDSVDLHAIHRELLGPLVSSLPGLDGDAILQQIADDGAGVPLGHEGVLITHVRVSELDESVVAAGRLSSPRSCSTTYPPTPPTGRRTGALGWTSSFRSGAHAPADRPGEIARPVGSAQQRPGGGHLRGLLGGDGGTEDAEEGGRRDAGGEEPGGATGVLAVFVQVETFGAGVAAACGPTGGQRVSASAPGGSFGLCRGSRGTARGRSAPG